MFALKPLRQEGKQLVVQWHWLKTSPFSPKQAITDSDIMSLSSDLKWGAAEVNRQSGVPLETGQTFTIEADDPELLPSLELLELQWNLMRIAAMSGAAQAPAMDFFNDDAGEGDEYGLSSEAQGYEDRYEGKYEWSWEQGESRSSGEDGF